ADPIFKGDGGALHGEAQGENHSFIYEDNMITGNTAPLGKGGGIHLFLALTASTVAIRRNTIQGNDADLGGGIGNFDCPTGGAAAPCAGTQGNSIQIVEDNTIKSNTAASFGGAVFADISDLTFERNLVEGNSATTNHPGLYFQGTRCAIIGANKFLSNTNSGTTGFRDGAVRIKNLRSCPSSTRSAVIENNFFWNNRGVEAGALAIISGASSEEIDVVGNSFVDNVATNSNGGAVWTQSDTNFRSNIFARHNLAVTDKWGIRIKKDPDPITVEVFFNDFYQNESGLVSDPNTVLGGATSHTTVASLNSAPMAGSNTALNPSFVAAGSGNLHLGAGSAVIDQGDCLLFTVPKVDIDGDTRPAPTLGACDMGADEVVSFALTVAKAGSGAGTVTSSPAGINCGGDCAEVYTSGTVVNLTPTPGAGSAFTGWSGDADCLNGQVTMSAPRSCTATFVLLRTLDVSKLGGGTGLVTSSPSGIDCGGDCIENYVEGTIVNLSAVPDFGSEFGGWGGPADCTDGSLGMLFDFSCTATFNACSIDSIVNLPAQNVSGSPNLFEACNRLTAGSGAGGFNILDGATSTLRAGNEIVLENGFTVGANATFTAILGPP
ncbi:MAG: hypothetical protein IH936_10715, partial [Acidobacteria bacterium]|nr:hypothetical protein [Acidobacteriota bacterium]